MDGAWAIAAVPNLYACCVDEKDISGGNAGLYCVRGKAAAAIVAYTENSSPTGATAASGMSPASMVGSDEAAAQLT